MRPSHPIVFLLALSLLANLFFFVTSQEKSPAVVQTSQASNKNTHNQVINELTRPTVIDSPINTGLMPAYKQASGQQRPTSQLMHLQQLFELNQFDRLAAEWETLLADYPSQAVQLKKQWLVEVKQGLQAKEIDRGLLFLDAWLSRFANDFDARWIKATDLLRRENTTNAVDTMFNLVGQLSGIEHEIYSYQKKTIIEAQLAALKSNSDWTSLIKLLEHLLWYQPSNRLYAMEVANAYFQLGQYQQSIFRLESLINDDDYGKRAQALLSEIDRLSLTKASFPLVKQSAHYLIDAQLNNHQITLLIDTGASISVLSEWFFEKKESQFNAEFVRHATIDTAGGRVEAPIYRFENFAIGEYRVRDIEFVVMALSQNNSASQGLLGMNFLKNFAFNLDQDKQQLILQSRD